MVLNSSLRFFGARPPAFQWRQTVACRWKSKQPWMLQSQQGVGGTVAIGNVERAIGIERLDTKQKLQVSLFVDSLLDWNQRMNLTAVADRDAVMERHVMDSLALLPVVETAYSAHCCCDTSDARLQVVDVGSGAGLPGLILAIARPAWQVTLLESLKKRCNFLEYAVERSGLSNITVVRARAEESGQDGKFRGAYDVAVARAVAEMRVLFYRRQWGDNEERGHLLYLADNYIIRLSAELCLPLVRLGGLFVAAKGPNPQDEVEASRTAIRLLGASLLSVSTVASEGPLGQRTAIVCHKQKPTPAKYPRKAGTPGKSPL